MYDAYIYDGVRTPFGRYGGALSRVRPDDLLALVLRAVVARQSLDTSLLEDVYVGVANQAGEDCRNVARMAVLLADLPLTVGGQTINRLCGSSLAALIDAARTVHCGDAECVIAAGVESMSRAPFVMPKADSAFTRNNAVYDTTIGSRFQNPALLERVGDDTMPQTGDIVATEQGISREQCDEYAHRSQLQYQAARERGFFSGELLPVQVPVGRRDSTLFSEDEHPRANVDRENLASLPPLFAGGVVTAGNASGVNDGAAGLLVGNAAVGARCGLAPRARIVSSAVAGVAPRVMGIGPVEACRKALVRAHLDMSDIDVIEINEAFASQVLSCLKLLKLPLDDTRVNSNGGAIAIGHPLGASGARIALTAMRRLEESGARYALVSMCIGVGQGIAMVLERSQP